MTRLIPALIAAWLLAAPAQAHEFTLGALTIEHPWARPGLPNRPMAAFAQIQNAGPADRLIAVAAPGFAAAELHVSATDGDVQTMRQVSAVEAPAQGAVALAPGGIHIMLFGGTKALRDGDSFPLTLTFERAGSIEVTVNVEPGPAAPAHDHSGHAAPVPQ